MRAEIVPVIKELIIEEIINITEASLWTKKYLTEFSIRSSDSRDEITGIKLSMFSSRPTHIHKNELELAIISKLRVKEE